MKGLFRITTALLLTLAVSTCAFILSAGAAEAVYNIDGTSYVFLGAGETVSADMNGDGTSESYSTHSTLTSAMASLTNGGVIGIVGEFRDPTTNGDSTFKDTATRGAVTIRGIGSGAVLKFDHTLEFKAPVTLEDFTLHCRKSDESGNSTKYVFGGGDTVFGSGFKSLGGIYYGNTSGTSAASVKTTFNSSGVSFGQYITCAGYSAVGSASRHGNYEFIINDIKCTTQIALGFNNKANTVYGNINCIINGGTFNTKKIILHNTSGAGSIITGAVSVIFNNGMADGFTVADEIDFVVKSGVGGTASIKTPAAAGGVPTFKFTPNEGYVPSVGGVIILANADGEYLVTPSASSTKQTIEVSYLATSGDAATAAYYSIDGVKTGFVKAGGGVAEYDGISVVAFDTIKSALTANADKADVTLVIIGESSTENLSYAGKYPSGLLTIRGADENAVLSISSGAHPWGSILFENIALDCKGSICADGNKIIFGRGLSGTMPSTIWGGGATSPHGGNIEIHSGKWNKITVGSDAVTSATSEKTQSHSLTIYGGDFTEAIIDFGSTVQTDIPKNMVLTVYGGEFAENQTVYAENIGTVGGSAVAIYNNGMYDAFPLDLSSKFKYIVKVGENGKAVFDGERVIVTANEGYAPIHDGKLLTTGVITLDNEGEYKVDFIKASGTAAAYEIDGVKTAYVKTGGGIVSIDDKGKGYYAFADMKQAVVAAVGGRVCVIGEYTGSLNSYWGGNGVTVITGYDDSAVLTLSELYMWTPLKLENIKISGSSGILNADSRPLIIGSGVEVIGNGLSVYGSTSAATRSTDLTLMSGKYSKVVGGNVGSDSGLSITLRILGGDYTNASVNLGNESAKILNGYALLELSGGVFSDGQEIKYNNLTTKGNAVAIVTNDIDKTYNLVFSDNLDYVIKVRDGGSYSIKDMGSESTAPTFIFESETEGYSPIVNGTPVKASASGVYEYTPELSDTKAELEITWGIDTSPRAYLVNDVPTVFVSASSPVSAYDTSYYSFDTLTNAVAALEGLEGKVIIVGDVTNSGGDSGAFVDTANRKHVMIEGLTGDEVLYLDGTFGFKGDVTLNKLTLCFSPKSLGAKYLHGGGNVTFGKDFKVDTVNGAMAFFAPVFTSGVLEKDVTVKAYGGTFGAYNVIGAYKSVPEGISLTSIIDGATVQNSVNLGYSEATASGTSATYVDGAVTLIINTDTVSGKKIAITEEKNNGLSLSKGVFTLIFNNGIDGYEITDAANAVLDYIVYSGVGGKASVVENGTETTAPTFLLTPDEGYAPKISGVFIEETRDGFLYTPTFTGERTTLTVEWIDKASMLPTVYEIDGEKYAFVKSGGGVLYYGNEARFSFADINSAVSALGKNGGNIKVYGSVQYVDKADLNTNLFADVTDREKVTITGIPESDPVVVYYQNANLSGDLEIDDITFHRLADSLYDTGFITRGYELTLGEGLVTTTDFSQNMTVHGVSGHTITLTKPQVINIAGGTITRVLPGTTWAASTLTGDSIINISGGKISTVFGGSHGGQSNKSIINGNVTINISGGSVSSLYSGGNSKSVLNGNVLVNITDGIFSSASIRHGNATDIADNKLTGNSIFVISGGTFDGATIGDGTSRGVEGEEVFIINSTLEGLAVSISEKGTVIYYDPDGAVEPAFNDNGELLGYRILCDVEGMDIIIDGEKANKPEDNIYSIGRGEHTVLFSTPRSITFDLNGAEGTTPEAIERYNDTTVNLTAPDAGIKNHYFNGWSTDKNAAQGSDTYTVPDSDSVLYAIWTEIKPELSESSNIDVSGASSVEIASVNEADYDTAEVVAASIVRAETDAVITGEAQVVYAFTIRAYDDDGGAVRGYENGISFRIPKYVLPERQVGEFYRVYKLEAVENARSGGVSVISYTEDEDYLYFTDYSTGDYAVMLASSTPASYLYKGSYNSINKKYTLILSFKGAEASFGSFGISYDREKLTLDSFTFGDEVKDIGSVSVAAGGFGTYYSQNGCYVNTWIAENGVSIEAEEEAVVIGVFEFTASEGFNPSLNTITETDPTSVIEIPGEILETVYDKGAYLYAPCIPSIEVYCQPIYSEIDTGAVSYGFSVGYAIERSVGNSYISCESTSYDNAATITVKAGDTVVSTFSEKDLEITSDENGKAVILVETTLVSGNYTIEFVKNGYVKTVTEFTVGGENTDIGIITPVCGDIKSSYNDSCGDGVVDIDDFIRVIRGFAAESSEKLRQAVDVNESGLVDVTDLSLVKKGLSK